MKQKYFNREIGQLKFNKRVFELAKDRRIPLLERVNYLEIFHSNMDEFFMKRVGGIKHKQFINWQETSIDDRTPEEELKFIRSKVIEYNQEVDEFLQKDFIGELKTNKIILQEWNEISEAEKAYVKEYYKTKIFPVLTPLAVDQGRPFPLISNLSYSFAISLRSHKEGDLSFARIKLPKVIPFWIRINPEEEHEFRFISLVHVVRHNLHDLFPNMIIENVMIFRLTRNIDIEANEEDADDLLELISDELKQRKFAEVVRLEYGPNPDDFLLNFLIEELDVSENDIYELPYPLELKNLATLTKLNIPKFKFFSWAPCQPAQLPLLEEVSIFNSIKKEDILVHHPFESFSKSVEQFISEAANDPKVVAIKMTLYRTNERSSIVEHLIQAAEAGKHVVCVIELKARMDEEKNIFWAKKMEKAGVHVVYGIVGLKIHAKVVLVIREEQDKFVNYCHIGTGNYHANTAKLYTDFGFFTCNKDITFDVCELFHYFTGRSKKTDYRSLLIAPVNLKSTFLNLIYQEAQNAQAGLPATIVFKMNSLGDKDIIDALYEASSKGVKIRLIVRGFSCLRAKVPGLSENIEIVSILGRFLEHTRIFYFQAGQKNTVDGKYFIGSADMMYRNLVNRVEAITPITSLPLRQKIQELLDMQFANEVFSWHQVEDGSYRQKQTSFDKPLVDSIHYRIMEQTVKKA